MKSLYYLLIPALMLAMASFSGCENKAPIGDAILPTTPFTLEGCSWINILLPDTVYIVNSSEELANYVDCESELPQIDFSKQTLLVARGMIGGGVANITVELSKTGTEYSLNVDIKLDDSTIAGSPWRIAILTNKLETNPTIRLVVNSHQF